MANREQHKVAGIFSPPIRLFDQVSVIDLMVVPELPRNAILSIGFGRKVEAVEPQLYSIV